MVALGRRVNHDPRSWEFPARRAAQPRSVLWAHDAPVLDQLSLGACTGFALTQCLNTARMSQARKQRRYLTAETAVDLYSLATRYDDYEGQYPPDDFGSSGLGVAKAGVHLGFLSGYRHAFGFEHFAAALAVQPVIVGTSWYSGMFDPNKAGVVKPRGALAGGHEYLVLGINYRNGFVTGLNSWGPRWGDRGRFRLTFDDFAELLAEDGDVTVPIGK